MSRQLNPSQVWSQVPVANRLIEVNTKTGFSLTAGSYSIHATSNQRGTIQLGSSGSATSTVSSVTLTRSMIGFAGCINNVTTGSDYRFLDRLDLTSATVVTGTAGSSGVASSNVISFDLEETY